MSIPQLVQSARFIFSGTVLERGKSGVAQVPHSKNLVTARLDRNIRVDPVLGDLRGRTITVAVNSPERFSPGQRAVFFANSWVHGRGIAVREVDHVDIGQEGDVTAEVAELPHKHLRSRLAGADLVVLAEVAKVEEPKPTFDRHAALWSTAELRVLKVLKGEIKQEDHTQTVVFYFPTADYPPWNTKRRVRPGDRGIFILTSARREKVYGADRLPEGALVALDPADFHEESYEARIGQILTEIAKGEP
jgi:hypothetical protein